MRTARDSTGASLELVAQRAGFHLNMAGRYEHPSRTAPVPDHVAEVMRDILNDFDVTADDWAEMVRGSEDGVIPRYTSLEAFYEAAPALRGWGERAQGQLVAEVQRRLQAPVDYR